MMMGFTSSPRIVTVSCTIDIEHTFDSLHAHVELDGVEVGPGDEVIVHDPPADPGFGEHIVCRRTATVVRAGPLRRLWTKLVAHLELTELYEVGFSSWRRP